jgi:hypothetical protein
MTELSGILEEMPVLDYSNFVDVNGQLGSRDKIASCCLVGAW